MANEQLAKVVLGWQARRTWRMEDYKTIIKESVGIDATFTDGLGNIIEVSVRSGNIGSRVTLNKKVLADVGALG